MAANILQEYLVKIGWQVDQPTLRKFDDAMRAMANSVNRYTNHPLYGIAPMFLKAGAAVTGVLASIAAGTAGLLTHTAKADLDFQLLARRMFMSADAARQMKIATDALGYSLEDIIWGPPELQARYRTLIEDQRKMGANLGGQDWENQMRRIRDVEFEFTRFKVELQYFGMQLAGTIAKALFGDHGDLLENLKYMNEWFQNHIPEMADKVTKVLVPALEKTYDGIVKIYHMLKDVWDFFAAHPILAKTVLGAAAGGLVGGAPGALVGGIGGAVEGITHDWDKRPANEKVTAGERTLYQNYARVMARKYNVDPSLMMGLIDKESGWNPSATNPESKAYGFGQFMPDNRYMYGMDSHEPYQNLEMTAHYLSDLLSKYHGNAGALSHYGGFTTKDPNDYINDIQRRAQRYRDPNYHPTSMSGGGINVTVQVASSNASAQEIGVAVAREVRTQQRLESQRLTAQFGGVNA